jgi:hypothetical protein
MDVYLKKRRGTDRLQFVYPVPADVRPLLKNERQVRVGTGTSDHVSLPALSLVSI